MSRLLREKAARSKHEDVQLEAPKTPRCAACDHAYWHHLTGRWIGSHFVNHKGCARCECEKYTR